jgi:regulator of replication initiation timing
MGNEGDVIYFKTHVKAKDLEAYSKALFEENQNLMLEISKLKEKVEHLEDLLINTNSHLVIK